MQINNQIGDLLYHYDCVIIPEFGGFVTNYQPAQLNKKLHLFQPPSKAVSFNKNLVRNDGLLAHYLADTQNCTFEEANAGIKKAVENYFNQLNRGERVVFNKVGILYRDEASKLRFQPSREENFLKDAFGLEQLFAVPAAKPESEPIAEPVRVAPKPATEAKPVAPVIPISAQTEASKPEIEEQPETETAQRSYRWAWAAVIALPILAYSGWLVSNADLSRPANLTIADLNPFGKNVPAVYEARTNTLSLDIVSEDSGPFIPEADEAVVQLSFTEPPNNPGVYLRLREMPEVVSPVNTYVATPEILSMRYHVVGGCFGELDNAQGMVDELRAKGFGAFILDYHKGLYRVTFSSHTKRKEALSALKKVKSEEMDAAWLLIK